MKGMNVNKVKEVAKAVAAGIGAAVSYLIAVLTVLPPNSGLGDLNTVQWLSVVPVVLAVYGVTWAVPNRPPDVEVGVE